MKGYIYLSISIISEGFATAMLKVADGFSVLLPSIGVVVGYGLAFYCLSLCLHTIPLSIAYAIWSGMGTVLAALIGFIFWGEIFSMFNILGMILIIGGIIVLNASESEQSETAKASSR